MSVALHYQWSGPAGAPVLVLGSSLGTTGTMWEPQLPALHRHFRVLRYDHRGHGASPTPAGPYTIDDLGGDVLALLDTLGVERVSYAGLSLGGMVGMWLAATAPERVNRLVLCCTSARFDTPQPWIERAAQVRANGTSAVAEQVVARWFTPAFAAHEPALIASAHAAIIGTPRQGYAGCCDALAALDLRPLLPAITAPTLVVAGADDQATPPAYGRAIAAAIRGARLAVIPGAAHLANVEAPDAVTALLVGHLAQPPGMAVRREVLGDAHVDRATAGADAFTADFQDLITRYAWGEIWSRPGLDRRTRSAITLAMLATLHHDEELAIHVRAALRTGLTREEIKEVLLQVAIYAGAPAANRAFAVAQRTFQSLDAG